MTWDQYDVYVVNANGSGLRRVTHENHYRVSRPRFSFGGKEVVYAAAIPFDLEFFKKGKGGSLSTILRVEIDGKSKPNIVVSLPSSDPGGGAWANEPDLSHDGKQMVFLSDRDSPFSYDAWAANADGTGIRKLGITRAERYNQNPTLVPDGSGVYYLAGGGDRNSVPGLWYVRIDGTRLHQIANSSLFTNPRQFEVKQQRVSHLPHLSGQGDNCLTSLATGSGGLTVRACRFVAAQITY